MMTITTTPTEERLRRLEKLYKEMCEWSRQYDPQVVERRIDAIDPCAELFIVGEAYAQTQVRLTGVNWFNQEGKLGLAGKNLDTVLRCVQYTLYPPKHVQLVQGLVPARQATLKTAYTTDIFPGYPPTGTPTQAMLNDALEAQFLAREFEVLEPKVVLLLGGHSYRSFCSTLLHCDAGDISEEFRALSPTSVLAEYQGAKVIPFLHPSPANPRFSSWLKAFKPVLTEQPQIKVLAAALE